MVIGRLAALLLAVSGHPLHTSLAELGYDPEASEVRVAIRIYSDDLAAAVPGALQPGADSALARYARERFSIADREGGAVPLVWSGALHDADAVVLRLRGTLRGGLRGARVASTILHERFRDQVNVVRATEGGHSATLLFLRGDAPRTLP